jgi:D-alanine-D-alanine ligase
MRVAVLYNLAESFKIGNELEIIAHNEIFETATYIQGILSKKGYDASLLKVTNAIFEELKNFDFVFNLAEDINGDIITETNIPATLDNLGIPYTGSNELTLTNCINKVRTKKILCENNILNPAFEVFEEAREDTNLDFPLIVKPIQMDGSIGIETDSFVTNKIELKNKIQKVLQNYNQPALVEEYIDGHEINVSLIGNGDCLMVLPLREIIFDYPPNIPRILTYEAKWIKDSEFYKKSFGKYPTELDRDIEKKIEDIALHVFKLLGCRDYARIDFKVDGEKPYIIEVNTKPCLNPIDTSFISSAESAGFTYEEIIYEIFKIALDRYGINTEIN